MQLWVVIISLVGQLNVSGYVESRPYLSWNDSVHVYGYNRGWLEFKTDGDNYGAQLAFDCTIPYDSTSLSQAIEKKTISRLCLWFGPENLRLTAGKQRLYWGVARIFRPLDVFNRINFFEPGYERPGSNALLGYLSLGSLTSIRGVYLPADNWQRSLYGLRVGSNIIKNDIGLTVMHKPLDKKTIVGGEIAGELAVGYWCELSYTWEDTSRFLKTAVGIDYTFPLMIYSMVEFFYDGSGEADPADYDFTKIVSGERTTLGQEYLYCTVGLVQNPFLRPSLSSIINLNDRGAIVIPNLSYSPFDNGELNVGLNFFLGPAQSEFKQLLPYTGQAYIWFRVYI